MPPDLHRKWLDYFTKLFQAEKLSYSRCLKPKDAVGKPWLLLFSDGSDSGYGFAAYVRWELADGSYWVRLIMAKSRIAPLHKVTTPRMELNGAVLAKRGRQVIEKEMRFEFERTLHLVDSETVMNMLHKTSTRFQIYEGTRIGEIQALTQGDMSEWAWIPGTHNIADWVTRAKDPEELNHESEWVNGPAFLYQHFSEWPIKFGKQSEEISPGEKRCLAAIGKKSEMISIIDLDRFSDISVARTVIARVLGIIEAKSFKGGRKDKITPRRIRKANLIIIKMAQHTLAAEDYETRYKNLQPKKDSEGMIVVGTRMSRYNPLSQDAEYQALLPTKNRITQMLMKEAHEHNHGGRDSTLAKFREKYWVAHGDKVAKAAKDACQLCKLRDAHYAKQIMGQLPEARLKQAPPFNISMLDMMGPYGVRGEVQKRTSGKCYYIIMTDLGSHATHVEVAFGYDTESFLMAFSRFSNLRGCPAKVYSDPGSQLIGADRELQSAWKEVDKGSIIKDGAKNGIEWIFGPADSPWHQGAVESFVKIAKRSLKFVVHGQRLSASEHLAIAYEVANLMNERPMGTMVAPDSEVNILTPNCLLLGRASARNPGGWLPGVGNMNARLQLVSAVADAFWKEWRKLYAPTLIRQSKWHKAYRNFKVDDVVLVSDNNELRGEYRIARVVSVNPGIDGQVRKVQVAYKNYKSNESIRESRTRWSGEPSSAWHCLCPSIN